MLLLTALSLLWSAPGAADPLTAAGQAHAAGQPKRVLELLPLSPADPGARLLRARALLDLGWHAQALPLLERLERRLTHLADLVLYTRGEAQAGAGQHRQAVATYLALIKLRRSNFEDRARQRLAESLARWGRWGQAARAYGRLLHGYPDHPARPDLELARARAMARAGWRTAAAHRLQEIWLLWPPEPAARAARAELDRMLAAGVKLAAPAHWREIKRVQRLSKAKQFDAARAYIARLRRQHRGQPVRVQGLDLELARVEIRAGKCAPALPLLQAARARYRQRPPAYITRMLAACLADVGRVKQGAAVLLQGATLARGRLRPGRVEDALRAVVLLSRHGEYSRALKLMDQHRQLTATWRLRMRRAWLAYRSGDTARAAHGFAWLARRRPGLRAYAWYWQARALHRAGKPAAAYKLYRELMEKHLRSYYGLLARSRLVEAGELARPVAGVCTPSGTEMGPATPLGLRLAGLAARHGGLLPGLRRAHTLWRLGWRVEALRQLRLVGVELSWIRYRGRPRQWIVRPTLERVWYGGPPPTRRFGRRARAALLKGEPLRRQVGALLEQAGVFNLGWRLRRSGRATEVARRFPQAYPALVAQISTRYRLDPHLVWSIMRTESSYRPDALSPVRATGLMQIMPYTGRRIASILKHRGYRHARLFEPAYNLDLAGWYLRAVMDKFHDQVPLVAAAYNGGPHRVARWLRRRGQGMDLDQFIEEIPFSQSRRYAKKVVRLQALYERVHCGKDDRLLGNALVVQHKDQPDF